MSTERFWSHVDKVNHGHCWVWTGALRLGYGRYRVGQKKVTAHRFAYEALVEPIAAGLSLDHICRNRSCVNPAHLEPVTHLENVRRGDACRKRTGLKGLAVTWANRRGKTECRYGHSLADAYVGGNGRRSCRTCKAIVWQRKKAAA
jgi:hypothetical protein